MPASDPLSIDQQTADQPVAVDRYQLFIDGAEVPATMGERIERRHPSTQTLVASYACANERDVAAAVDAAKRALGTASWRDLTADARAALLLRAADALQAGERDLARVIAA